MRRSSAKNRCYPSSHYLPDDFRDGASLIFDSLKQAQLNTGASANSGVNRIGAWNNGGGSEAYSSLQTVARGIENCVANR